MDTFIRNKSEPYLGLTLRQKRNDEVFTGGERLGRSPGNPCQQLVDSKNTASHQLSKDNCHYSPDLSLIATASPSFIYNNKYNMCDIKTNILESL